MSALTARDISIAPTSNPQEKQMAGGEENKLQDALQHKGVVQKSLGNSECVKQTP